jgi:phosphatidyl-myo-inositol dimannoside synthase
MEAFLRDLTVALGGAHDVKILARRITPNAPSRIPDGLVAVPAFDAFRADGVLVEALSFPPARRALLSPLVFQGLPVTGRFAWGRARVPAAAYYSRIVAPVLAHACRDADVIHMWGADMLATAAVRAGHGNGQPVVITPFIHPEQWGHDPASRASFRAADAVVALHDTDAATCRRVGVPATKIHVCGVCTPGITSGGGLALRQRLGIEGPLVLFLGVRRPYKGWHLLLEAAPLVRQTYPQATFAFVGPGPRLPAPSLPHVIDAGAVTDAERAAWLDAATIVCLPSSFEILPVTILEAWSLGKPVVTSDIPTLEDLVGTSGGGVTTARRAVDLAGTIMRLLESPELAFRLGAAGRSAWEDRFRPGHVAALHETLYSRLLGKR